MDKADTGLTHHSKSVGSIPKDCIRCDVGQEIPKTTKKVSRIEHDDANFNIYGSKRYLVYITIDGGVDEHLWRSYENLPVSLLYDI